MNNLNEKFENLNMNSTDLNNFTPPSSSPIFDNSTSILANTSDLVDIVNNVYIHMEAKNGTNQNNKSFSDSCNDFWKSFDPNIQTSNDLSKESFIQLLRAYKAYLDAKSIEKSRKQTKNFQNQYSLEEEEDAMETENRFEFNNINNNKEILYEIKSFIRQKKFKTEFYQDIDNAFEDKLELIDESNERDDQEDDILPRNLIVTSIPIQVFTDIDIKLQFEKIFTEIDAKCNFCYFRLFKRCCIQYEDSISAVLARFELDNLIFLNERLNVFLSKPIKLKNSRTSLQPPENDKAFLISPPSSPPVGWEQVREDPPVVNIELLAALSKLNPREPCEIIKSQDNIPGIVIHPCFDSNETSTIYGGQKKRFIHTRRPNPNDC